MLMNQPKTLKSKSKGFDMKKHYVTKWMYYRTVFTDAACGKYVCTLSGRKESTYRKNHVTCKNCRRTKEFRDIK